MSVPAPIRALSSGLLLAILLLLAPMTLAASPTPTPRESGDPRGGTPASLIGEPLLAAAGVIGLGLLATGLTVVYVRLGRRD